MFGTINSTDGATALLNDLNIDSNLISNELELLNKAESRYLKDIKVSLSSALQANTLQKKEAYLIALAVAVNEKHDTLKNAFTSKASEEGANEKELAEAIACASLLSANNVYYRFRHFMDEEFYNNAQAGIRMNIMASPVLGKELFELISTAISAVNGCEMCVRSHEKTLVAHGSSKQRIHDAVRLAAVVKSLSVIL